MTNEAPDRISEWAENSFWPLVDKTGDCWIWTGSKMGKGYGSTRPIGHKNMTGAHRVSWMLANGRSLRKGEVVMHKCDNPPCVNPAHLSVGSQSDNIRDCVEKGRHVPFIPEPKRFCKHGHEFTVENTEYVMTQGRRTRRCIECRREIKRRSRRNGKDR